MNPIKNKTQLNPYLSEADQNLSLTPSKLQVQQVLTEPTEADEVALETIKKSLEAAKDLKSKKASIGLMNQYFIQDKTLNPSFFKEIYKDSKKIKDSVLAKNLEKSPEKDQMLLSILRDSTLWRKDFLDDDYKCFLKAIQDTASKDEAYALIGKHCDDNQLKLKIVQKIQDTSRKDNYILSILADSLDCEAAIQLAETLSTLEMRNQAYVKLAQSNYNPNKKIEFIRNIEDPELKKEACLHLLKSPNLQVGIQLEVISLIPDELYDIEGVSKDALLSGIAHNKNFGNFYRYKALKEIQSTSIKVQVLEQFDKEPQMFEFFLRDTNLDSGGFSKILLGFYFLSKASSVQRSFGDLMDIASCLQKNSSQVYPGYTAAISDYDAAFLSLALDSSFSLDDRLSAFQKIKNLETLAMDGVKKFLRNYLSERPNALTAQFHHFELLSSIDFRCDIPLLLLANTQDVLVLYKLIEAYHTLPKGHKAYLQPRMEALSKVIVQTKAILESLTDHEDEAELRLQSQQIQSLKKIQTQAELKAYYLKKIPSLKQKAFNRISPTAKAKYNLPENISVLNVLGDMPRNLDPLKREGLFAFIKIWEKEIKSNPQTANFWLWLDQQNIPNLEDNLFQWAKNPFSDDPQTSSVVQDERYKLWSKEQKRVQFKEGIAYNATFGDKDNDNRLQGNYIYAIGQDGQLYISPYYTPEDLKVTHDTILKGKNILSAGIVKFDKGKLVYIDDNSGHYAPERFKNLQPTLAYLLEKNPNAIAPDTQVGSYETEHPTCAYGAFKDMQPARGSQAREKISIKELGFKAKKPSSLT